jgi:CRP/FNR family cyclic AMP-dependent transcriptional regulator
VATQKIEIPSKLPSALRSLLGYCRIYQLPSKRLILRPGDPVDKFYYIIDGSATVSMEGGDGSDIILTYLNGGDFIGETGVFVQPQSTRQVTVRTRTPCVMAEISYKHFQELANNELKLEYPEILHIIARHISGRLIQTTRKVGHLAFMDVAGRIASTLLDLCKQPDALTHPDGMQIKISHTELGKIVGCSRVMAGRVMKNMEQQGLIAAKGKTVVVFGAR